MRNVGMFLLRAVLFGAIVCAGIEALDESTTESSKPNSEDNLNINDLLKLSELWRTDEENCENVGKEACKLKNKDCKNMEKGGYECEPCKDGFKEDKEGKCVEESCDDDSDCKHNGTCSNKLCDCLSGFRGNKCEIIVECETGQYKFCKDDKGSCDIDDMDGNVLCKCDGNKELDNDLHYCRKKCSKNEDCVNGICNTNKFCQCDKGYTGDFCDVIEDCITLDKTCEKVGAKCLYNKTLDKGYCECKDSNYAFVNEDCKTAKWCITNTCKTGAKCEFTDKVGSCKCKDDEYYDYNFNGCKKIDPCLIRTEPCGKNKECDSSNGNCKCIVGFSADGENCKANICENKNPCFEGASCTDTDIPGIVKCTCKDNEFYKGKCEDGSCFIPKQNCSKCPPGMKANDGVCEHESDKKCSTEKDCGFGWCIKSGDKEECVCKDDRYTENKKEKCVLKPSACATGNIEKENPSKCNCITGNNMYKLAKDGITCERKSCVDEDVQKECKRKRAKCVDSWKISTKSYHCKCDSGYKPHPETGICTDVCSLEKTKSECSNKRICFVTDTNEADCKCSPTFTYNNERNRCEPSDQELDFILHNLPVKRDRYFKDGSIDTVKLHKDVREAMEKIFLKKELEFAGLYSYQLKDDNILLCEIWLQFKKDHEKNLERWKKQVFTNDTILPPALLLSQEKIKDVSSEKLTFCSDAVKMAQCGPNTNCKDKECSCKSGYKVIESTVTKIGGFVSLYCEDINECVTGVHKCSENTTCMNSVGSYYCKCKEGFKKSEGPANEENQKPCTDLCLPNPCVKGRCENKNNTIDCTCDAGFGGSLCNREDHNLKKASRNTVIVGAVLGTLLGVVIILLVLYIRRQHKNSYSEDFTPAPRIDNAEMVERRPMRGVSNRAYQ